MSKTKKKRAQNSKAVAQQSIQGIESLVQKNNRNGLVQKNKKPKFKSVSGGGQTTSLNNSKTQNKNKLPQKTLQKTTDTKSGQNFLQNNEKELKEEQYSLKGKKNISNKSQNKPANKEITLNFERNSKERLEVDDSDSDINEGIIPQDTSSNRDGSYEEEELDLIISDIDRKRLAYDDKDDVTNDEARYNFIRTIVKDSDNVIEVKEEGREGKYLFSYEPIKINRTAIRIELDVLRRNCSGMKAKIKEMFEKFGSIKNIMILYHNPFGKRENKIGQHELSTIIALIDYHCPISARKAFSMNEKRFKGNLFVNLTVHYRDNYLPLFTLDIRKCVCLSNLTDDTDNNTIWKVFSTCGEIEYVYLPYNEQTGSCQGLGWIVFMSEDAVGKAIELNGTLLFNTPVIVRADYPMGLFGLRAKNKIETKMTTEEIQKVLAKQDLPYKSNDNNPSKKFKNNSEEAVAHKAENERNQKSQKSNVGLVENKPSTSFQGQKANFKQKKNNKKFNKQKKQMARKLAAKPNKPAKV